VVITYVLPDLHIQHVVLPEEPWAVQPIIFQILASGFIVLLGDVFE
tara:strand:- start:144 stop:281 length:138 start_codon:yes stop_codon:yes gene_type:complete